MFTTLVRLNRFHGVIPSGNLDNAQGTKYFGGHSDLLCGILVTRNKKDLDTVGRAPSTLRYY
mgnify:CR=1 FL=1